MSEPINEYKKSFKDELDWNLLEQLHKVVLQISSFCFRTKQICLTVEIAIVGILIKFTGNKLDKSLFVACLIIPLSFWLLDSIAYFYQVKIRGVMENIIERLKERNDSQFKLHNISFVIEDKRVKRNKIYIIISSFFNHSMWLYLLLILSDIVLWVLYNKGVFQ